MNNLADFFSGLVGSGLQAYETVTGRGKTSAPAPAPAPAKTNTWEKYLPWGIGALVLVVVLAMVTRK